MVENTLDFKLSALRINQREEPGKAIYLAVVKARDFFSKENERFIIDYYHRENGNETGYQRRLAEGAVEKIKDYILKEVKYPLLPTSLLVNAREEIEFQEIEGSFGKLNIKQPLYIIDGQHRFEAWKALMSDDELKTEFGNFEFPVVILSNFAENQEIEQFYVINSRQKRIKTDLAQRNLLRLVDNKDTEPIVPESSKWTLYATRMVDVLNEEIEDSIWSNKIMLPNDSKDLRKRKIISQASFVSSLKPFFIGRDAVFMKKDDILDIENWSKFIDEYWQMIKEVYPEAIENMHDYSLMKTVGVFSLHLLLAKTIGQKGVDSFSISSSGKKEIFDEVKRRLLEAKQRNMKLDFWRVKVSDVKKDIGEYAGAYSSSVGHNKIVSRIMLGY